MNRPTHQRRNLICSVAHAHVTYAIPIWTKKLLQSKGLSRKLEAVQRRVISVYHTVSIAAVAVLVGILRIKLRLKEQLCVHSGKKEKSTAEENYSDVCRAAIRQSLLTECQQRWENDSKGRCT